MATVIETRNLQKKYGRHLAVDGIGLKVENGSVFGLIGPNGAGKTTVLRMLVDIIRPTSGELTVLGSVPQHSGAALRRRIGYLPGELQLNQRIHSATLLQHLAQISGPVAPGTIETLAERLNLDLHRPVRSLSKGNRQKIGLIQAFMHRPELLILDEPTSGLDPLMQREFLALVREAREGGQTVLLSSHILSEIQHIADDVAVLAQGRIVAQGDVASLRISSVSRLQAVLADTTLADAQQRLAELPMLENLDTESSTAGGIVRITATIRGEVNPVIRVLAQFNVSALTIEEPDLEESILNLYTHNGGVR